MPPKRAAKKPSTASTTTKGKGTTGSKQFTAADAKQLAELQKAQKAAHTAEQAELKNVTRKRTAALLEKEARDANTVSNDEPDMDLRPPSRKHTKKRSQQQIPSQELEDSDDSCPGDIDTVKGLLNFNADTSSDEDDGDDGDDWDHRVQKEEIMNEEKGSDTGEDGRQKTGSGNFVEGDEVVVGDDVASASTTSRGSSKVMLSQFSSPRTKRIANIGNRSMRRHAALIEAFPATQDKESTTWDIIVAGCKSNALLAKRLGQLDSDVTMKDMLVNYTWQGLGSMRAELIFKARQGVPMWYGLFDMERGEEVTVACKWLLKDNTFLYREMKVKKKLLDKNKPWMHPGLVYLICEQFWSVKGDAIKMGKQNNLYLQFPDPLLSLSASMIQCTLRGFTQSGKLKGAGSVAAFTDESYRHEFASYKSLLSQFQSDMPTYYKLMRLEMQDALKKVSLDASSMLKKSTTMKVDMEAVEEAAKKVLAEREAGLASDLE